MESRELKKLIFGNIEVGLPNPDLFERVANKVGSISSRPVDTKLYPNAIAVYDLYDELNTKLGYITVVDTYGEIKLDSNAIINDSILASKLSETEVGRKVTSMSSSSTDNQYPSAKCVYSALVEKGNLVIDIDQNSTDTQYPSAKCVYLKILELDEGVTAAVTQLGTRINNLTVDPIGENDKYISSISQEAGFIDAELTPLPVYSITRETSSEWNGVYRLTKNGVSIGDAINIPKDMVVKDAGVVDYDGTSTTIRVGTETYTVKGTHAAGVYVVFIIQNSESQIWLLATDIAPLYTGETASDGIITVDVNSSSHIITATINDNTIPSAKLSNLSSAGTYPKVTINSKGLVVSGSNLEESDIPAIPMSRITGLIDVEETISAALNELDDRLIENAEEIENIHEDIEELRENIIKITWAELRNLRDEGKLKPGKFYQITDYICTTTQTGTRSANHSFDIIVRADSEYILNENAWATYHSGDTYFANEHIEAWQLKYCLDNDATRFTWADTTNGRGVIYYLQDEYRNEADYDFKNIQFLRDSTWKAQKAISTHNKTFGETATYLTATDDYYYTFTYIGNDNIALDLSMFNTYKSINGNWGCSGNIIKSNSSNALGNNIFVGNELGPSYARSIKSNRLISCHSNTFGGRNVYNNLISGAFIYNNVFADNGYTYSNQLTDSISDSIFNGCFCNNNIPGRIINTYIGGDVMECIIQGKINNSIFGSYIKNDLFSGYIYYSTIDGVCINNHILNSFVNISVTGNFSGNIIGGNFENNTITGNFSQNLIKHNMGFNIINQSFVNNSVAQDMLNNVIDCYFRDCEFGNKVQYVHFNGNSTQVNNYRISNGLHGTSGNLLQVTPLTGSVVERTLSQSSSGNVIDYCMADVIESFAN